MTSPQNRAGVYERVSRAHDKRARSIEQQNAANRRDAAAGAAPARPHGLAPSGYARRYAPVTRELIGQEPDPVTAPVVEDIITRVAGGEPIEAVVRDLNDREVPSPRGGKWTHATVRWGCPNRTHLRQREHHRRPPLDGTLGALGDE